MKNIKITILFGIVLLTSCVSKKSLSETFYSNTKKVGVIFDIEPANVHKEHKGGLVDISITNRKKFSESLETVNNRIDLESIIKKFYLETLKSKNKPSKSLNFNFYNLKRFKKPNGTKKKYR